MEDQSSRRFSLKDIFRLLKGTYKAWNNDDPWRLSAVVAYYALLSLPALLVIVVNVAGSIYGQEAVTGELTDQVSAAIGKEAAQSVEEMILEASKSEQSILSTIIGIGTLLFGATGVFFHLQKSLNQVWNVRQDPKSPFKRMVFDRVRGFGFVLVIGFLLLLSLALTSVLSVLSDWFRAQLPDILIPIFFLLNFLISFGVITVLFALIFKFLPDVDIQWRTVWIGAIVTSLLFSLGEFLLGIYFGHSNPGSTYGAAGSLILILLWVSYSCLILFFGAEFTQVFAKFYGHPIQPSSHAVSVKIVERIEE
ncbi:YihY/virulence factor BrkB family protein [Marinoscillum pacificum]|uniref:YihY/virulence factor BrkB family protein n=1 Tax=Marinoscillum pacificum TaxID=392723 RepID=UPI00215895A2|nr:YihY/virulence factor BrkB family protein [Marinoscillum pacificum]